MKPINRMIDKNEFTELVNDLANDESTYSKSLMNFKDVNI